MRRSAPWIESAMVTLSLLVPSPAFSQCTTGTLLSDSDQQLELCSGQSTTEARYTRRTWSMEAGVSCRNADYFGALFPSEQQEVAARGECGNSPGQSYPQCFGTVGAAQELGLQGSSFVWRTSVQNSFFISPDDCGYPTPFNQELVTYAEGCTGSTCCGGNAVEVCEHSAGEFYGFSCTCVFSPIIIGIGEGQLQLTDAEGGVTFDLKPDGRAEQLAWTMPGTSDAFLALDRNGNGVIDSGKELFGSVTVQPPTDRRNGFNALSAFDENGDRRIDPQDPVFPLLRLWTDRNHNGQSESNELQELTHAGLVSISLEYREVARRDRHGNFLKYAAPVRIRIDDRIVTRMAWDVFLVGR